MLWGFDGVVLTPRLYNLDVAFVVFALHLIPFSIMQMFLWKEYETMKRIPNRAWLAIAMVAITGGALGTLAIVKALFLVNFQKLTIVVLLQKLQPVFAIALATLLLKERLRAYFYLWAGIAILAGYFLTFGFSLPKLDQDTPIALAAAFSLLAAFSFGSSTIFSKMALRDLRFETATFIRYGLTALILLPYILISGKLSQIGQTTAMHWVVFLVIGLTTGSGAIFLFYYGLRKVKASVATICELFFPLSAILFDYIFNDSRLTPIQWISAAIMIFAIIQLNRSDR
jgi:drug/metabolite transporter (DMT)-like permease